MLREAMMAAILMVQGLWFQVLHSVCPIGKDGFKYYLQARSRYHLEKKKWIHVLESYCYPYGRESSQLFNSYVAKANSLPAEKEGNTGIDTSDTARYLFFHILWDCQTIWRSHHLLSLWLTFPWQLYHTFTLLSPRTQLLNNRNHVLECIRSSKRNTKVLLLTQGFRLGYWWGYDDPTLCLCSKKTMRTYQWINLSWPFYFSRGYGIKR